jgi:hypothetical protein
MVHVGDWVRACVLVLPVTLTPAINIVADPSEAVSVKTHERALLYAVDPLAHELLVAVSGLTTVLYKITSTVWQTIPEAASVDTHVLVFVLPFHSIDPIDALAMLYLPN